MNTDKRKGKLNNVSTILDILRSAVASAFFPFVTAAVTLVCYYLALDMVIIWYMAICGTFILLFSKDITPLITLFLFMNIMISMENSPTLAGGNDPSDYYFQVHILAQIGVAIGLFASAGILRMVLDIRNGRFKCSPTFFGLCLFAVAIMFNGIFSEGYTPMNAVYGFFMAFLFLGVFIICSGGIRVNEQTFSQVALSFIALSVCMIIELAVAYCTYDNLWTADGSLNRTVLYYGWGMYNTMGMLLTISMPAAAYLARVNKTGWLFTVYLIILEGATLLSLSRQAMLCGTFIFIICVVWILMKRPGRAVNIGIFAVAALAGIGILVAKRELIYSVLAKLLENFTSGSGRAALYAQAWQVFLENPVFGEGFYRDLSGDPGFIGLPIMPDMYHNTVFELLAVGGLVAFIPYVIHRTQTVISFVKRPTHDRFYVALTIGALLILSLLDNHIFYILPTLVYSFMTALLVNSESSGTQSAGNKMLTPNWS